MHIHTLYTIILDIFDKSMNLIDITLLALTLIWMVNSDHVNTKFNCNIYCKPCTTMCSSSLFICSLNNDHVNTKFICIAYHKTNTIMYSSCPLHMHSFFTNYWHYFYPYANLHGCDNYNRKFHTNLLTCDETNIILNILLRFCYVVIVDCLSVRFRQYTYLRNGD